MFVLAGTRLGGGRIFPSCQSFSVALWSPARSLPVLHPSTLHAQLAYHSRSSTSSAPASRRYESESRAPRPARNRDRAFRGGYTRDDRPRDHYPRNERPRDHYSQHGGRTSTAAPSSYRTQNRYHSKNKTANGGQPMGESDLSRRHRSTRSPPSKRSKPRYADSNPVPRSFAELWDQLNAIDRPMTLNKRLALSGICSRRKAVDLIQTVRRCFSPFTHSLLWFSFLTTPRVHVPSSSRKNTSPDPTHHRTATLSRRFHGLTLVALLCSISSLVLTCSRLSR
jgi:hypothetical protein